MAVIQNRDKSILTTLINFLTTIRELIASFAILKLSSHECQSALQYKAFVYRYKYATSYSDPDLSSQPDLVKHTCMKTE